MHPRQPSADDSAGSSGVAGSTGPTGNSGLALATDVPRGGSVRFGSWGLPLLVGLAGWLAALFTLTDPGPTADEPFNVIYGKLYVSEFLDRGRGFFREDSINLIFAHPLEAHQHPPLGRWLIGWMHWLRDPRPKDRDYFDLYAARMAPATAFGLMLVLVSRVVTRRHGQVAGIVAGVSLVFMPRVFAHAHFAALDTMTSCTYLLAVVSAAWMLDGGRLWLRAPLAGLLLGCALLTKMHGLFLLPLVAGWVVVCCGWRGVLVTILWGSTGVLVFFAGWQWLWLDVGNFLIGVQHGLAGTDNPEIPLRNFARLWAYLYSGVEREHIYVWYFGRVYSDSDLPWHYPWVLFGVTVPVGLHLLGLCGLVQWLRSLPYAVLARLIGVFGLALGAVRFGQVALGGKLLVGFFEGAAWALLATVLAWALVLAVDFTFRIDRKGGVPFDVGNSLFAGAVVFPLLVFTVPGVPVYDGVRMFLMAFPVWAMFVGQGTGRMYSWLAGRWPAWRAVTAVGIFVAAQAYGVLHYHPFQLSYFNLLACEGLRRPVEFFKRPLDFRHHQQLLSGVRGAEQLGLEVSYWGDAITPELVDRWSAAAPEKATAVLMPTLYNGHSLLYETAATRAAGQRLIGEDTRQAASSSFLIVYNRRAYLSDEVRAWLLERESLVPPSAVDGVVLGAVYERQAPGRPAKRANP